MLYIIFLQQIHVVHVTVRFILLQLQLQAFYTPEWFCSWLCLASNFWSRWTPPTHGNREVAKNSSLPYYRQALRWGIPVRVRKRAQLVGQQRKQDDLYLVPFDLSSLKFWNPIWCSCFTGYLTQVFLHPSRRGQRSHHSHILADAEDKVNF